MKSRYVMLVAAVALLAALVIPVSLGAQNNHNKQHQYHHYQLIDLGTFGGPRSYVALNNIQVSRLLNSQGTVAGWADTSTPDPFPSFCFNPDCFVSHTFQSRNGVLTDLGALPGGASSASDWISANGLIAGLSENGQTDPLIPGFPELRAVLWQNGGITDLGTLPEGGYESLAYAVNDRGQVAGAASNTVPDPNSMFGLGYQTRAFLWQNGAMRDLGTLGSGTDAQAVLINEKGQVAGWSYTNSTPTQASGCSAQNGLVLTTGSFLWDNRNGMVDLGTFGGTCTLATDLNNRGQVAGLSYLAGDLGSHPFLWGRGVLKDLGTLGGSFGVGAAINDAGEIAGYAQEQGDQVTHGFLWKNGLMTDLGTVDGDQCSFSFGINANAQVLGSSLPTCSGSTFRASLWEDGGPMVDLNALVPPGSSLYLTIPGTINDRGEIAGLGLPSGCAPENSDFCGHAFLLIPCDENHLGVEGCDYSTVKASAETRVSPALAAQHPTALAPGTVMPGRMLNHFRFPLGQRSPSSGAGPAPGQKQEPSAHSIRDYGKADQMLDPEFCWNCRKGHCWASQDAHGEWVLNGYCIGTIPGTRFCSAKGSSSCPSGAKAENPQQLFCGFGFNVVDEARACSF